MHRSERSFPALNYSPIPLSPSSPVSGSASARGCLHFEDLHHTELDSGHAHFALRAWLSLADIHNASSYEEGFHCLLFWLKPDGISALSSLISALFFCLRLEIH